MENSCKRWPLISQANDSPADGGEPVSTSSMATPATTRSRATTSSAFFQRGSERSQGPKPRASEEGAGPLMARGW